MSSEQTTSFCVISRNLTTKVVDENNRAAVDETRPTAVADAIDASLSTLKIGDRSLPAADALAPKAAQKRTDYISWEEMFMGMALLAAQRSKDPYIQVGAVIANKDNVIVSVGYNGMPVGCSDDEFPWGKEAADPLDNKHPYVCHAEMNAILNKNCSSIFGSTIYTTYFPCNECTKLIIQSKIEHVIYMEEKPMKPETKAAKRMLDAVGVKHRQFTTLRTGLTVEFPVAKHRTAD